MTTATELSPEIDNILINAVRSFLRRSPNARLSQEFDELKHEAWLLLPKVEREYDNGKGAGDYTRFAVQRLAWRLFDVARTNTWAPRSVKADDRKKQMSVAPVGDKTELTIESLDANYDATPPADALLERDALRDTADRLKSVLPLGYQVPFELYYVEGLTMRETAERLDLTESRISQKLFIARRIIHERFPGGEGVFADRTSTS